MRMFALSALLVVHVSIPGSRYTPGSATQQVVECKASDVTGACTNMLKRGWNQATNLIQTRDEVLVMAQGGFAVPTTLRRSSRKCRNPFLDLKDPVSANYTAPADVRRFPATGTAGRDFVVAIFSSAADEGCWEHRYGFRKKTGEWDREAQFVTVNFSRVPPPEGAKRDRDENLGRWTSWAISSRVRPGATDREYRLEPLETGKWKLCKDDHPASKVAGFLGCAGVSDLHALQASGALGRLTMDDAIVGYTRGDTMITRLMRARGNDPFTDAAWGQCGNMGCCALDD